MIPKIKFDDLVSIQEWADALAKILDAATEATKDNNSDDRIDLASLLLTFIKRSPAKVELLDVVAKKAIDDLALADISASLERITSRNAELSRAIDMITAVTSEARKDSRALKLESAMDALTKAKAAVDLVMKLEKKLNSPDADLIAKLKAVGAAITDVAPMLVPEEDA